MGFVPALNGEAFASNFPLSARDRTHNRRAPRQNSRLWGTGSVGRSLSIRGVDRLETLAEVAGHAKMAVVDGDYCIFSHSRVEKTLASASERPACELDPQLEGTHRKVRGIIENR